MRIWGFLGLYWLVSLPIWAEQAEKWSVVVSAGEVDWGYLNPLRGDQSPAAANLWGDRTKNSATGMLVKFKKGFVSPPHIHNISYRGVVLTGAMHNDDPQAETMWMPPMSFWTQPAGENHITAANGQENMIYLEIDAGPYLVKPADTQFDNGERPVNVHRDNLVWQTMPDSDSEVAWLWGVVQPGKLRGALLQIPAGFKGVLHTDAEEFRAIVVSGNLNYQSSETTQETSLTKGSYFASSGRFAHQVSISSQESLVLYVRSTEVVKVLRSGE